LTPIENVAVATLIVDGANVVGSRPDGWWRDRAGAAARLHAQLLAADLPYAEIVLVLEGKARAGVPAGADERVRTVHAPADGDATIAELARAGAADGEVVVVTADRGLSATVASCGARVIGPGRLLDQLT
jgi:predicted RNA-binding protein with PIN domain